MLKLQAYLFVEDHRMPDLEFASSPWGFRQTPFAEQCRWLKANGRVAQYKVFFQSSLIEAAQGIVSRQRNPRHGWPGDPADVVVAPAARLRLHDRSIPVRCAG